MITLIQMWIFYEIISHNISALTLHAVCSYHIPLKKPLLAFMSLYQRSLMKGKDEGAGYGGSCELLSGPVFSLAPLNPPTGEEASLPGGPTLV